MSMFRRRLLMMATTPKNGLPAGWKEVEYVYFDNKGKNEYIDTGIIPDQNTKVELIAMGMHNDYSHDRFFGVDNMFLIGLQSGGCILQYNKNGTSGDFGGRAVNGNTYVHFIKDGVHNLVTLLTPAGDIEIPVPDNTPTSIAFTESRTLWAGRANNMSGWPTHNNRCKLLKIWQSGEPVRDFIPVSDGTQEALYDQVTKTLFYKQT